MFWLNTTCPESDAFIGISDESRMRLPFF